MISIEYRPGRTDSGRLRYWGQNSEDHNVNMRAARAALAPLELPYTLVVLDAEGTYGAGTEEMLVVHHVSPDTLAWEGRDQRLWHDISYAPPRLYERLRSDFFYDAERHRLLSAMRLYGSRSVTPFDLEQALADLRRLLAGRETGEYPLPNPPTPPTPEEIVAFLEAQARGRLATQRRQQVDAVTNSQERIRNLQYELTRELQRLESTQHQLDSHASLQQNLQARFTRDLNKLMSHPKVQSIRLQESRLIIVTVPLVCEDNTGHRYQLPSIHVAVNLSDNVITLKSPGAGHEGYWTKRDPHPHVNGSSGLACWGNSTEMIATLLHEGNLFSLFTVVVQFLEHVNIDDAAGKKVFNWPSVVSDAQAI